MGTGVMVSAGEREREGWGKRGKRSWMEEGENDVILISKYKKLKIIKREHQMDFYRIIENKNLSIFVFELSNAFWTIFLNRCGGRSKREC